MKSLKTICACVAVAAVTTGCAIQKVAPKGINKGDSSSKIISVKQESLSDDSVSINPTPDATTAVSTAEPTEDAGYSLSDGTDLKRVIEDYQYLSDYMWFVGDSYEPFHTALDKWRETRVRQKFTDGVFVPTRYANWTDLVSALDVPGFMLRFQGVDVSADNRATLTFSASDGDGGLYTVTKDIEVGNDNGEWFIYEDITETLVEFYAPDTAALSLCGVDLTPYKTESDLDNAAKYRVNVAVPSIYPTSHVFNNVESRGSYFDLRVVTEDGAAYNMFLYITQYSPSDADVAILNYYTAVSAPGYPNGHKLFGTDYYGYNGILTIASKKQLQAIAELPK